MGTDKKIEFSLINIKTEEFAIINDSFKEKDCAIDLVTSLRITFNDGLRVISLILAVQLKQEERTFLKLEVKCEFEVSEKAIGSFNKVKEEKYIIPRNFLLHLGVMTVGSVRGVLHSKTEGTKFNKFILPSINLTTMINEDMEFNLIELEEEE